PSRDRGQHPKPTRNGENTARAGTAKITCLVKTSAAQNLRCVDADMRAGGGCAGAPGGLSGKTSGSRPPLSSRKLINPWGRHYVLHVVPLDLFLFRYLLILIPERRGRSAVRLRSSRAKSRDPVMQSLR